MLIQDIGYCKKVKIEVEFLGSKHNDCHYYEPGDGICIPCCGICTHYQKTNEEKVE